jgi:hypothetical protein
MFMKFLSEFILHSVIQILPIWIPHARKHIGVARAGCHLHGLFCFWQY